jgi:hypothetical protein
MGSWVTVLFLEEEGGWGPKLTARITFPHTSSRCGVNEEQEEMCCHVLEVNIDGVCIGD